MFNLVSEYFEYNITVQKIDYKLYYEVDNKVFISLDDLLKYIKDDLSRVS